MAVLVRPAAALVLAIVSGATSCAAFPRSSYGGSLVGVERVPARHSGRETLSSVALTKLSQTEWAALCAGESSVECDAADR